MAVIDWGIHQEKLISSKLSIRKYCEKNGLNYNSARNKLKKNKVQGALVPKKLKLKPATPKPEKKKRGNLNAAKHFGYARHYAIDLLSDAEIERDDLNQEIAVARMQLSLVIKTLSENSNDSAVVFGSSEPIQRLLGRIDNLISSQIRLDDSATSNSELLKKIFEDRRSGGISAIEAAYLYMEKGLDVPPLVQVEARLEIGGEDDESELPKGGVTPQIVEERERQLQLGNKQSADEFMAERLAELEVLNEHEKNRS